MKLLVDADSLIFSSAFADTLEIAKNSFDRKLTDIVNHLEEFHEIEEVRVFNGSLGNFRNILTKKYKYFEGCVTDYQYRKRLYLLFKEVYKSKAKEKYSECYNLLKLRTQ